MSLLSEKCRNWWKCIITGFTKPIEEDTPDETKSSTVTPPLTNDPEIFKFKGQKFVQLRDECLAENRLFVDPFGPTLPETENEVTWRRPRDISANPQFFVNSFSRFDTHQGLINNCWFIVAAANLVLQHALFERVVPPDNCYYGDAMTAGIFHFRLWQNSTWYDVVIDDQLPTIQNGDGEIMLLYTTPTDRNEYWGALLEKAYAKLNGGYSIYTPEGVAANAMQGFTGGVIQSVDHIKNIAFDRLLDAFNTGKMIAAITDKILVGDIAHVYSITKVIKREINNRNGKQVLQLIRLRNPWGNESQWIDTFENKNKLPEWDKAPNYLLQRVKIEDLPNDGEFWMTYENFAQHFQRLEFCNAFTNAWETSQKFKLNPQKNTVIPECDDLDFLPLFLT